jgi:hypothetical protein
MFATSRSQVWRLCCYSLVGLALLTLASPVRAVSISGILLYSTDDFGNPNGYENWASDQFQAQAWRTLSGPNMELYGLGVASGLPPESINEPFLNFPDFSVEVPLDEGENYFTFFAEPGPLTATDDYQRFLVNLYFDGNVEEPGVTVLFPRFAEPDGSPVTEARPNDDKWFGLNLQKATTPPNTYYDDGLHRVSVLRASLLSPERANISVDRVDSHALTAGDDGDWVGVLVVSVEPSESFGAGGGVPPLGRTGSGGGGGAVGGGGAPAGGSAGYIPPGAIGGQPVGAQPDRGVYDDSTASAGTADGDFWHSGDPVDRTPDEIDATATPGSTAEVTASPAAATTEATPQSTQTPAVTTAAGTKTPAAAASPAVTPTPVFAPAGTRTTAPAEDTASSAP